MSPQTIRLGTASPSTQPTTAATLTQLEHIARRAAAQYIDLLLLPEAYLGGYPRGTHFGSVIGARTDAGREEYLQYFRSAVDLGDTVGDGAGAGQAWVRRELIGDGVTGSETGDGVNKRGDGTREELERIARETGVFVVTGLIEKAGGSMYCSVVYVCPKLGIIGKRRKVMPTGTERLVWAQGSPATLQAVSTVIRGVRINLAAAICWENYMPLVRQSLYAQNINLYLAPTADGRDTWLPLLRTIGIEGRCFVVSSNMCVRKPMPEMNGHVAQAGDQDIAVDGPHHRGRRASVFDEDGNEIVLPDSMPSSQSSPPTPRARRQSVFDEDGNEIVLCATDTTTTTTTATNPFSPSTSTANLPTHPPKQHPAKQTQQTQKEEFLSRGGSSITSPFGTVLAGPQWEDPSPDNLIYADVDFDDCVRGRLDLDMAGSYSRNDSFRLEVAGLRMEPLPY